MEWEDYLYPNTTVLKNKFDERDQQRLAEAERISTTSAAFTMPEVTLDKEGLKQIHGHLFGDVYDWAGEFRQVGMAKAGNAFVPPDKLDAACNDILSRFNQENQLKGMDREEFAERAAHYLGNINIIHPFREGNGRTQREFFTQIAERAGYELNFKPFTAQRNKDAFIDFYNGNPATLTRLIEEGIDAKACERLTAFNASMEKAIGERALNNLHVTTAKEGLSYGGRLLGGNEQSFALQLPNEQVIVIDNEHFPAGKWKAGDEMIVKVK